MCFSATASFVTAAGLAPVGIVSLAMARRLAPERWQPLALMPILFAIQQELEGFVWLGLDSPGGSAGLRMVSLAYLGFAYALWPVWIPWSALRLATGLLAPGQACFKVCHKGHRGSCKPGLRLVAWPQPCAQSQRFSRHRP